MRILFHKNPEAPFFLSLDFPEHEEISRLDKEYSSSLKLFHQKTDEFFELTRLSLLRELTLFLEKNRPKKAVRSAKSVSFFNEKTGFRMGPAKGIGGFMIEGQFCSADVTSGMCEIVCGAEPNEKRLFIDSARYRTDDGCLMIEYRRGTSLFDFMFRLHETLKPMRISSIWALIES